jgi:hypothetical protein
MRQMLTASLVLALAERASSANDLRVPAVEAVLAGSSRRQAAARRGQSGPAPTPAPIGASVGPSPVTCVQPSPSCDLACVYKPRFPG